MQRTKADIALDPKYEEEVSGCTASVGLISEKKIYVVSLSLASAIKDTDFLRQTLATHGLYSVSRVEQSRSRSTTSRRTKVNIPFVPIA